MKKVNQKMIEKIRKLRKKGLSYDKIGEKLGLSHTAVLYVLNKKSKEKARKWCKERWRKDKKYREYHKEMLRKERMKAKELRRKYEEYDKIALEYKRNSKKIGYKKAYRIFKEKLMRLRKKYNVYFPTHV
jgi:predicted transcriptional regulator